MTVFTRFVRGSTIGALCLSVLVACNEPCDIDHAEDAGAIHASSVDAGSADAHAADGGPAVCVPGAFDESAFDDACFQ